jgi:hypothetical protein
LPVAKQNVALRHETPVSHASSAGAGFGAATTDQLVPFHRSINGARMVSSVEPTAKQFDPLEHARSTMPRTVAVGAAIGTRDHAPPSQRSAIKVPFPL